MSAAFALRSEGASTSDEPFHAPLMSVGQAQTSLKGEDTVFAGTIDVVGHSLQVVAIYDGHGGKEASAWCTRKLAAQIAISAARAHDDSLSSAATSDSFEKESLPIEAVARGRSAVNGASAATALLAPLASIAR